MKFITTLMGAIFGILFLYYSTQKPIVPYEEPIPFEQPKPDSNKEVEYFDWQNDKYVYKDEAIKETKTHRVEPLESYPDFFVQIVPDNTPVNNYRPRYIKRGGVTYRMYFKENGQVELIPSR